jgi:raffinose/stachyose/melibiose transport system permease protein
LFSFKFNAFFAGAFALGLMITVHAVIIPLFLAEVRIGIINLFYRSFPCVSFQAA